MILMFLFISGLFQIQTEEIDGPTTNGRTNSNDSNHSVVDAINRQLNLSLPPTLPSGLSPQQLKRRYIFASIVSSECSYVATLQRLVNVSVCSVRMIWTECGKFHRSFVCSFRQDWRDLSKQALRRREKKGRFLCSI